MLAFHPGTASSGFALGGTGIPATCTAAAIARSGRRHGNLYIFFIHSAAILIRRLRRARYVGTGGLQANTSATDGSSVAARSRAASLLCSLHDAATVRGRTAGSRCVSARTPCAHYRARRVRGPVPSAFAPASGIDPVHGRAPGRVGAARRRRGVGQSLPVPRHLRGDPPRAASRVACSYRRTQTLVAVASSKADTTFGA